ncbi:hypothetical protein RRG08_002245 [Elysia crispata]|uniref:Molybdopterin synthase catalytic subunit n=1 Tax=Elysia crispata TaxID=231223 RepID=A0AAE0ZCQ5_9GAST|nr:hypothetical protein RRG08_002245 [Elysia crispata]
MDTTKDLVRVKLLFFAKSKEIVGQKYMNLDFPRSTTRNHILSCIVKEIPALEQISKSIILSLNEEYLDQDCAVTLKAVEANRTTLILKSVLIFYLPEQNSKLNPEHSRFSNKMDFVDVVEEKLKVDEIIDSVSSPSCGAVSVFVGTTRDNFDGKEVLRLEYEAYLPMARRKMLEVCANMRSRWAVENISMIHRIGVVPVKEASIVIAISSPHRKESLEAVQYAIETVKAIVPVWKKEIYADDSASWKKNKECAWGNEDVPSSGYPVETATKIPTDENCDKAQGIMMDKL